MDSVLINFLWILIAALIGFIISAFFAGILKLNRNYYLTIYIPIITIFFFLFIQSNEINFVQLITHNLLWGLIAALVASFLLIRNVLSQPASPRHTGSAFMIDIIWPGMFYGFADALFLSVLPVLAVYKAFSEAAWITGWMGQIGLGALAILASFFITAAYHWGYPEFRNKRVFWTLLGNGIMTLAFILTMNPLAAVLPHMIMHIAAMTHGPETTGQVPPHYGKFAD